MAGIKESKRSLKFSVELIELLNNGDQQQSTYHIQNRSAESKKLRAGISKGSDKSFSLLTGREEKVLAAGLRLPVVLSYIPRNQGRHSGAIELYCDDKLETKIPIQSYPPCASIQLTPTVINFDDIALSHQRVTQTLSLNNNGTANGTFSLDVSSLPTYLSVSKIEGVVEAKKNVDIEVTLLCREVCTFQEQISVSINNGTDCHKVAITGSVSLAKLELMSQPNFTPINVLSLGPMYYDSSVKKTVTLYNNSPSSTQYVTIMDTTSVGHEEGVDMSGELSLACTTGGLYQDTWREQGDALAPAKMLSISPAEGIMNPYETCNIEVTFSPTFKSSETGWQHHQGVKSQRDYSLFVKFNTVGCSSTNEGGAELGVTATVVPTSVTLSPVKRLKFGSCITGLVESRDLKLTNNSDTLNAVFKIQCPAHFKANPSKGTLKIGETQTTNIIFHPKQFGRLDGLLYIDIYSNSSEDTPPVHTHSLSLIGSGIISGGLRKTDSNKKDLASLTDLTHSIRPHDKRHEVITPFTKVKRHTYVDPDYALTEQETVNRTKHRGYYQQYVRDQQTKRHKTVAERKLGNTAHMNGKDIGIQPAAGICPPKLSLADLKKEEQEAEQRTVDNTTWSNQTQMEATGGEVALVETPFSKPCSVKMAEECQMVLTPRELSMIEIDPSVVDMDSLINNVKFTKQLKIKNHLNQSLLCRVKVSPPIWILPSKEGRRREWVFILSPLSCTPVGLDILYKECGHYHQSMEVKINRDHHIQVPVRAVVSTITITPSSSTVTLSQFPLSTHNTHLQGSVTLHNPHSVPAHFSWDLKDHFDHLMVSNIDGIIPPSNFIMCHFQYIHVQEGRNVSSIPIKVNVEGGESIDIVCVPEYLKSNCNFKESVLFFNPASLYLPCRRTITCINKGLNHAYFEVVGCHPPVQGVKVKPTSGCIAAGGKTELAFQLTATELGSFESWFKLRLKEGRTLTLRVTGSVELPRVYTDLDEFSFGNVYCGSTASIPFTLYNKGLSQVHLTFNFTSLIDFSVTLPVNSDPYKADGDLSTLTSEDGIYQVIISANSSAKCVLHFSPKDVASYDFISPILINGQDPISPPPEQWPPSKRDPQTSVGRPLSSLKDTPKRRVMATTLVAPLVVNNTRVSFRPSMESSVLNKQMVQLHNTSSKALCWFIDTTGDTVTDASGIKRFQDGTFKFFLESGDPFNPPTSSTPQQGDAGYLESNETITFFVTFTPSHHGQYTATLPLYLNGDSRRPYRLLDLSADLVPERIVSSPAHIAVHPVPLGVTVEAHFIVILKGFSGAVQLEASLPSQLPDGVKLSVNLPDTFEKSRENETSVRLTCEIVFSSNVPVSITDCITFRERISGKTKKIPLTVCADNNLLSIYEFISDNMSTAQYLPDEHTGVPFLHLPSQSSVSLSQSTLTQSTTSSTVTSLTTSTPHTLSSTSYGGLFLTDCKGYMCRYLSLFGWPDGLRDIRHPTDLVQCVGTDFSDEHTLNVRSLGTSRGVLLDMIRHLCGRLPPGVPQTPVPCKTRTDRVNRHYQEITVTLAFLRSQGALLWAVVPEALMDWRDFAHWRAASPPTTSSLLIDTNMEEFRINSEQVWTHLIAQIIKVLVLPKLLSVVPRGVSTELLLVTKDQVSNVYNRHELLLLTWMNGIMERTRPISSNESRRPILSFDVDLMDCTVLASVISSYAPYMAEKYFDKMYSLPSTPEQVNHNALLLVEACREMNINYDIQPTDLSAPHPIGLLLFTAYLFHSLPSYTPHSAIALEGELGTMTTQKVKIENPSSRELVYNTTLIGGETRHCFTTSNTIAIPPHGSASMEIQFHIKHLHSCSAVLLLLSRTGTGRPGRTVAFTLNGSSTVAKPAVLTSVEARLYEPLIIRVPTGNMTGTFSISLTEGPLLQEPLITKKKRTGKTKLPSITTQNISIATDKLKARSLDAMKLFHASLLSVDLEKGQSNVIKLEYIPLKSLQRQCCISLSNDVIGDSVILVNTTVTLPSPTPPIPSQLAPLAHVNEITKTLHLKATVGESIKEEIVIENKNKAFENAIFELGKWEIGEEERERRRDTNSLWYTCLRKAMAALELDDSLKTHWNKMAAGSNQLNFTINTDSDLFIVPTTISVPANKHGKTVLPLEFSCDTEGRYSCTIVLRSSHDVRVYCVEVVVRDQSRMVGLEMTTPALEPVTQKIPITNPTTIDWPLSVELSGRGFSGPAQFKIKALTTGYYPLTFYPRREYTSEGSLKLVNINDDTEHCFTLRGVGERPQAQEKISIHTTAKTNIGRTLHVPNTGDRTTTYRVECDLSFVSGPPTITIAGGDVADYPVMIDPITRGQFSGAIVFIAESRSGFIRSLSPTPEYIWYHVDVDVDPALPFDHQTIKGHALDTIEHTLVLTNPFDSPTTLNVSLEGDGLSGPTELFVNSNSNSLYNLVYTPPKVGSYTGSVLITGREDGEMTIELELVAGNPNPVTLGTAQCELGKTVFGSLSLTNQLKHEVTFAYVTEDSHFNVVGLEDGQIVVPARSTADVSIMFIPTELGEAHTATLTFISNEFGQQDFLMEGIGLIPSPQDPTTISSQLDGNSMAIITFTNPLSHTALFDIRLETQQSLFCLFLKQSKGVVLQSGVSLDIPVMFAPETMKMSYTELIISINKGADPLVWLYPIHGLPVKLVHPHHHDDGGTYIKGRAKERVERTINVPLVVLKNEFDTKFDDSLDDEEELTLREKYMFDLVPNQDSYKDDHKPLKEFIGLQLVSDEVDSSEEVKLTFSVVFLPSKPLKFEAELHIQPMGNGLWRFPVRFEALEQIPDDRIFIKAQYLTREAKKTFRLTSLSDEPTPFSASFAIPISELSVSPLSGVLPPEGSSGVPITVTYAPRKFDKTVHGVLKIKTDSCQWSYEVIGEPIVYSSPVKNSKVDHKQASCTVKQSSRNFLRHNIKHAVSVQAAQRVK